MVVENCKKSSIFQRVFSPLLYALDCWLHLHVGIQVEVSTEFRVEIRGCLGRMRYVSLIDDVVQFKPTLTT